MNKIIYLTVAMVVLASCTNAKVEKRDNGIEWLLEANPETDAKKAIRSGDLRFIGLVGMLLNEVPRIDKNCDPGGNVRYISLDDVINNYEERKLQAIAPIYAEAYNHYIMQYGRKIMCMFVSTAHNKWLLVGRKNRGRDSLRYRFGCPKAKR